VIDLASSATLLAIVAFAALAYAARVALRGHARSARVEREGQSVLVGKAPMEMVHWILGPIGDAFVRVGIRANAVSWASLAFGLAAGLALGAGHFGVAAALTMFAALGDALDGVVARASGEASEAGEVLDAAIDRYIELAFIGGLAFYFRERPIALVLAIGAIGGSFMVSYATAKAEAMHVQAPRGAMRRTERVVYLLAGVALGPVVAAIPAVAAWADVPALAALALVAVVGNASAVRRLAAVARAVKQPAEKREAPKDAERTSP
jgi:CDP-diacylglycerol---glycerol-3-phosphate 3-phosphatidyltransferase